MSFYGLRAAGFAALSLFILASCASSQQKLRKEQREKAITNTRLYCEFLNGEQYPDIDVAVNLAMAQKCDAEGSMTLTNYKTPSEIPGIMFCCSVHPRFLPQAPAKMEMPVGKTRNDMKHEVKAEVKAEPKAEVKAAVAPAPAKSYPLPEVQDVSAPKTAEKVEVKTEVKADAKADAKTEVKTEVKSTKSADPDLDE